VNGVSVVICTYNGSRVIQPTLEALSRQKFSGAAEIVLVDNNSDDGVVDVATRFWDGLTASRLPLNVVRESQAGLAFARRTGVRAAKYDTIVFCDDDNWLATDYLACAGEALTDPSIGAVGGASTPVSDGELPPFFFSYAFHYAVGSPDLDVGPVDNGRGWLFGAGLIVRRADLLKIYDSPEFPTLTGRVGSAPTASGDDLELCFSLRLLGYKLVYDDRLRFQHFIEARKLDKEYLRRLREGNKRELDFVTPYKALVDLSAGRGAKKILRKFGRFVAGLLRGHYDRFAAFWLLAFLKWTPLMSQREARVFAHYRWLLGAGKKRIV
jgi:glycosyltransferase involved in cell wall biosynthesis